MSLESNHKEVFYMPSQPKYLTIKNDLKMLIEKGDIKVGEKIPSEADLRAQYSVSRHTIRQSISELVNSGHLIKQQGAGTFVSDQYKTQLNKNGKKTIGVITTYISDYIFPSIIRGIEEELSKQNYSLMLSSTRNNVDNEKLSLDSMIGQEVDGLIIEPTKSNLMNPNLNYYLNLSEQKKPLVMMNASYEELELPLIALDDIKAGRLATEHLIELGHKHIGMITKADDIQGKNRLKGYLKALHKADLTFKSNHILRYDTESKPYISEKINELLLSDNAPTAFVAYNDEIAVKLIKEIDNIGKNCPNDFSVVSHDNSFYSTALPSVKLTSIEHPKEELGKAAAQWIINAVEGKNNDQKSVIFEPKLVLRTSTKKIE